jgi:hypothetical protein
MKATKLLIILSFVVNLSAKAQDKTVILGQWSVETIGEDVSSVIEFRQEEGHIKGYCIEYTDENGVTHKANDMVHNIQSFNGKKGKTVYSFDWDGDDFTMKGNFVVENPNLIKVTYSYFFYKVKEVWTRK